MELAVTVSWRPFLESEYVTIVTILHAALPHNAQ